MKGLVEEGKAIQNAAKLLAQTLSEEEAADKKLTAIGERSVNAEAAAAGSGND